MLTVSFMPLSPLLSLIEPFGVGGHLCTILEFELKASNAIAYARS